MQRLKIGAQPENKSGDCLGTITGLFNYLIMIRIGTIVKWAWGNGTAAGKVKETFTREVTRSFKGTEVTRKGETGNKALLIEQENGNQVLKLESEISSA